MACPWPQYLNPATGNLTSVNNTVSTYNATTGMCTNVITDLNITMYYSLSNPDASDTPGYIDAVRRASYSALGSATGLALFAQHGGFVHTQRKVETPVWGLLSFCDLELGDSAPRVILALTGPLHSP